MCVNGDAVDEALWSELRAQDEIRVLRVLEASQKVAMVAGRSQARGEFFCFLDDDDELTPDSIEMRVGALVRNPNVDAAATTGYYRSRNGLREDIDRDYFDESDLFGSALQKNWNASCATLFRSAVFNAEFFDEDYRHARYRASKYLPRSVVDNGFSWTFATARMCLDYRITFIDAPGYVVNLAPESGSQSCAYHLGQAAVWRAISRLNVPGRHRGTVREKLVGVHHDISQRYLASGDWAAAVKHHLYALSMLPRGLRYLFYTRYFCLPARIRDALLRRESGNVRRRRLDAL